MKRSLTYKAMLGVGGLVLLFAYQNCSKVTSGLLIEDKEAGALSTPEVSVLPVNPSVDDGGNMDPGVKDPVVVGGGSTTPGTTNPGTTSPSNPDNPGGVVPPKQPPIPTETCVMRPKPIIDTAGELECADGDKGRNVASSEVKLPERNPNGIKYCKEDGEEHQPGQPTNPSSPTPAPPVVNEPNTDEAAEAVKYCDQAKSLAIAADLKLNDFHGQYISLVQKVTFVNGLVGSLILKAASNNSVIEAINNIRANNKFKTDRAIVLCGFKNVQTINNVRGHIILVDSHVRLLSDHVGRLTLINSTVDQTNNQGGGDVNIYARK